VAKYCDEHVCVSVCLSVRKDTSRTTRDLHQFFVHVAYGRGSRSSYGGVTSQGEGVILRIFFPIDDALYGLYSIINFATNDRFG